MATRAKLLESIAATIADYREGEIPKPSPEHVERWAGQFEEAVRLPLLKELDHVLNQTYFSRKWVVDVITQLVETDKLAGTNPCAFWKSSSFLSIQQNGHSQEEMLRLFDACLQAECGFGVEDCVGDDGPYIYLDDALFSGFRVGDDLGEWLQCDAPDSATVHVMMIAFYAYGQWKTSQRLKKQAKDLNKKIAFRFWRGVELENNPSRSKTSEVLWPAALPDDELVKAYRAQEHKFPFEPREAGGSGAHGVFSCEEGRQLLETQLLLAGLRIRSFCENPSPSLRPLGFSPFGLGFGATVVTFRNCPNNCPLALWWGDPEADESHPFSKWYPLLPRKTYGEESDFGEILFE